jgi:hypothetical protein
MLRLLSITTLRSLQLIIRMLRRGRILVVRLLKRFRIDLSFVQDVARLVTWVLLVLIGLCVQGAISKATLLESARLR